MRLRVFFPAPGAFLNDPRLVVQLGDRTLYDGSFTSGFDVSLDVEPGRHTLHTSIQAVGSRRQTIELPLTADGGYRDTPAVEVKLAYSRLTGNFKKRTSISVKH